jgi:hypothetical protein
LDARGVAVPVTASWFLPRTLCGPRQGRHNRAVETHRTLRRWQVVQLVLGPALLLVGIATGSVMLPLMGVLHIAQALSGLYPERFVRVDAYFEKHPMAVGAFILVGIVGTGLVIALEAYLRWGR